MIEKENYGKFIKDYRKKSRISQTELANAIGCNNAYISMIEANKTPISLEKLKEITKAINDFSNTDSSLEKQAEQILKS